MSAGGSAYTPIVRKLFEQLPGSGCCAAGAGTPVTAEVVSLELGAWVRFDAQVERGTFVDCHFRAWGCPHVLAASALVARRLQGSAVATAADCEARALLEELAAPAEKLGRLLVVADARRALLVAARAVQSS
jgi:NifU-like protein involved in Fe-S cluster formation